MEEMHMKNGFYWLVVCLLLAVMGSGCASIMSGTKHTINVECEPNDANILINGGLHKSPCSQDVERGINASSKNKVVVEKEGSKPCEFNTHGSMHPWVLGNILLGGLIGIGIDMGTGAAAGVKEEDIKMILYEDKPCDIYYRPRWHGNDLKWIKYGEEETVSSKKDKTEPPKEDPFKNIQTGRPADL
jgi:hypothetical protein